MGTEKQVFSVSRFPKSRFYGFVCLYLVAATALFLLCGFAACPDSRYAIADWQYVSSDRLAGIGDGKNEEWQELRWGEYLRISSGDVYVLLRRSFSGEESGNLHIKTSNALLSVSIGGETAYDSLTDHQNDSFSSSAVITVFVPQTDTEKTVTVLLYSPNAFSFSASLTDSAAPMSGFRGFFVQLLVFGVLFLVLALVSILSVVLNRREHREIKLRLVLPTLAFLLLAISLFIQYHCSSHSELAPDGMFALVSALNFLAIFMLPLSAAIGICGWNTKLEIVSALNIIYIAAILFWPYEVFFAVLLKFGVIFHLAIFLALAMLFKEKELTSSPLDAAVSLACFVPLLFFWLDVDFRLFADGGLLLYIPALLTGSAVTFSGLLRSVRAPREKKSDASLPAPVAAPAQGNPIMDDRLLMQMQDDRLRELVQKKCSAPDDHMLHVAAYTRILSLGIGLQPDRADEIAGAALLHDIGKLSVPYAILHKTGPLTEAEFDEIRRHHRYGERILSGTGSEFFDLAAIIAREHHEHVDGSGYLGIRGEQISMPAKIVAVADVLDALTSNRGYKRTWSFDDAYQYICERGGTYYDKEIVAALKKEKERLYMQYLSYHPAAKKDAANTNKGGVPQ